MKRYILLFLLFHQFFYSNNQIAIQLTHAIQALKNNNKSKALKHFNAVYTIDPTNEIALLQLGTIYLHDRSYEKSCAAYEEYMAQHPNHANILYNLGLAYIRQGNYDKSFPLFEKSYQLDPDNQSYAELLKSYLRNEQWHQADQMLNTHHWWYNQNIYEKTVLLELNKPGNGVGDAIQFLRYAKYLKQAGAHVIVQTFDSLIPLFQLCPFIDQLISHTQEQPPFDLSYPICIGSLIIRMQDHIHMKSKDIPYIIPTPKLVDEWKNKLKQDTNFRVGLCWNSRPNKAQFMGETLPNPRDIDLDTFKPLADIPGITFYCLQKNYTNITKFPLVCFENFDEEHGSFMDSAALIKNLDLVITIDTSMAHLAGAIGTPVWTILGCESDYRWFRDRIDTPWYPSMTLFRQQKYNDWNSVIQKIFHDLSRLILLES